MSESPGTQEIFGPNGLASGELLREFKDTRADSIRLVAGVMAVLGIAVLVVGILIHMRDVGIFGAIAILVGSVFLAFGNWRKDNRLFVYREGLVQVKRREVQSHQWRDVQQVVLKWQMRVVRDVIYAQELGVRASCFLKMMSGGCVKINAIPITTSVIQAIWESCESAGVAWHQTDE